MVKNFFKKHIFAIPPHFDGNTVFVMICGLAVIFSPIISCGPSKAELEAREKENTTYDVQVDETDNDYSSYDDIEIRVIDSCEYIIYKKYNGGGWTSGLCHKANCQNPFHQNQK